MDDLVGFVKQLKKKKPVPEKKKKPPKEQLKIFSDGKKPDCPDVICRKFELRSIVNRYFEFQFGWKLTKDFINKYKKNVR